MKIGLIAVDTVNFPNLPLMKLSTWHKSQGDDVRLFTEISLLEADRIYMSKIFSFTSDFQKQVYAKEIIKSGTGYYYPGGGEPLIDEIEHIMPDYGLYGIEDTAYGFLTRGCPRRCSFCIVSHKEGCQSKKVANLSEFWSGQKKIVLLDPNLLAYPGHAELLQQLIDSKAYVEFTQGMDVRLTTPENLSMIKQIKIHRINVAWDNYLDKDMIVPKLRQFKEITGFNTSQTGCAVLSNYDTTVEQDLERLRILHDMGYAPYFMIYEKYKLQEDHILLKIKQWCNSRTLFFRFPDFWEYQKSLKEYKQERSERSKKKWADVI